MKIQRKLALQEKLQNNKDHELWCILKICSIKSFWEKISKRYYRAFLIQINEER